MASSIEVKDILDFLISIPDNSVDYIIADSPCNTGSKDFVNWHPTTKNLQVLDRLIRAYSNPGDTVLDLFSGPGSTSLAAIRAGRGFYGCDNSLDYIVKREERIANG